MTTQAERQKPFDSLRSLRTTILVGLSQIPRSDIAFGTQKARCTPLRDDKKRRNAKGRARPRDPIRGARVAHAVA
jgi:hypothetical protein